MQIEYWLLHTSPCALYTAASAVGAFLRSKKDAPGSSGTRRTKRQNETDVTADAEMEAASELGMEAQGDLAELRRKSQQVNDSDYVTVDLEGGGGGSSGGGSSNGNLPAKKGYVNQSMITQIMAEDAKQQQHAHA